jgi:hypothetical protein
MRRCYKYVLTMISHNFSHTKQNAIPDETLVDSKYLHMIRQDFVHTKQKQQPE